MKRIILAIVLIPIIRISIFITWLIYRYRTEVNIPNNQILDKYVTEFRHLSHPLNTSSIAFYNGIYRSPGNGAGCFYFVAEIRKFSGDRKNIQEYYLNRGIQIEFLEEERFGLGNQPFDSPIPYGYHRLSTWNLFDRELSPNIYLIFSLSGNYEQFDSFDLRCH